MPGGAGDGPRRRRRLLRSRRRGRRRRRPDRPRPARPRRRLGDGAGVVPPRLDDAVLDEALAGCGPSGSWPGSSYDGSRRSLAALKNLTSDLDRPLLRQRPGGDVAARRGAARAPPGRPGGAEVETEREIAVLKGIAAHYVMQADDRVDADGAPAHAAGRAGRGPLGARPQRGSTRPSAPTRRRPPTTPGGDAWSSTRSPR